MMVEKSGGNLSEQGSDAQAIANAMGIKSATVQEAVKTETDTPKDVSQNQEAAPQKVEETPKENNESREYQRKAEAAHKQVVDIIQEKFSDLESGRMTDKELREWFKTHPEVAETADRSKRMLEGGIELKSKYRSLMSKQDQFTPKTDTDQNKEEQTEDTDDKPLTRSEFLKALEERETRLLERTVQGQREEALKEYAVSKNLKDDNYVIFKRTAEAIYKANNDWTLPQAMEAAYSALNPSKGQAMNVQGAGSSAPNNASSENQEVFGSTYKPIISMKEFTGKDSL